MMPICCRASEKLNCSDLTCSSMQVPAVAPASAIRIRQQSAIYINAGVSLKCFGSTTMRTPWIPPSRCRRLTPVQLHQQTRCRTSMHELQERCAWRSLKSHWLPAARRAIHAAALCRSEEHWIFLPRPCRLRMSTHPQVALLIGPVSSARRRPETSCTCCSAVGRAVSTDVWHCRDPAANMDEQVQYAAAYAGPHLLLGIEVHKAEDVSQYILSSTRLSSSRRGPTSYGVERDMISSRRKTGKQRPSTSLDV